MDLRREYATDLAVAIGELLPNSNAEAMSMWEQLDQLVTQGHLRTVLDYLDINNSRHVSFVVNAAIKVRDYIENEEENQTA
jgi:hypothetical protein